MSKTGKITLGELSRVTGVSKDALIHWEQKGLLHPERRAGGRRYFDAVQDPAKVENILDLQRGRG